MEIKQGVVAAQVTGVHALEPEQAGVHALEPEQEGNGARCYQAILDAGLAANPLLLPWSTCSLVSPVSGLEKAG